LWPDRANREWGPYRVQFHSTTSCPPSGLRARGATEGRTHNPKQGPRRAPEATAKRRKCLLSARNRREAAAARFCRNLGLVDHPSTLDAGTRPRPERRELPPGQADVSFSVAGGSPLLERAVALRAAPAREIPARARACSMVGAPFVAGTTRPGRGVLVGEYLWVHDGTRNVRRRRLWPKTRYHLLTTDGGIVADQPGKMAGEAAIGVVLKAPLEEISEPIGAGEGPPRRGVSSSHQRPRGRPLSRDWTPTRVPRFRSASQPAERQMESQGGAPQALA
jgi:hypothetical protein